MRNAVWLDNDMAPTTTNNTGNAGERGTDMNVDLTTLEGFSAARASWKAAGCPTDHPYLTAELPKEDYRPLAIEVTDTQWATVQAIAPILRAMSDANIKALGR